MQQVVFPKTHTNTNTDIKLYKKIYLLWKKAFLSVYPLIFCLAAIAYAIEPKTTPSFNDMIDLIAFGLFLMGIFALSLLHGMIVFQLKSIRRDKTVTFSQSLYSGILSIFVSFITIFLTVTLIGFGFILFILPGIYLLGILSLTPFLVLIYHKNDSFFKRIKIAITNSYALSKKHWWQIVSLMIILVGLSFGLENIYQPYLQNQIVLATLINVLLRSFFLSIWYTTMVTLAFTLKKPEKKSLELRFES